MREMKAAAAAAAGEGGSQWKIGGGKGGSSPLYLSIIYNIIYIIII